MNKTKIILHLMVETIEAADKGIAELKKPYEDMDLKIIEVQFKNIEYYARMIIQKDGVE